MKKKLLLIAVVMAVLVGAVVPVLVQADTASACWEGRTPGYWKNHTSAWKVYKTTDNFRTVFGVGPDKSLIQVLNTGGGKWDALHRHAVAALLNSTSGVVFLGPDAVIDVVQWAYSPAGNWASAKDYLEDLNESGE